MNSIVRFLIQHLKVIVPSETRGVLKHKYLCKWYGSSFSYALRKRRYRKVLNKSIIRVAFQVENIGKWKSQSVLDEMLKMHKFHACIWYVKDGSAPPEMEEKNRMLVYAFFADKGVEVVHYPNLKSFPKHEQPDMVFVCEPYIHVLGLPYNEGLLDYLTLYVPYSFRNTVKPDPLSTIITHAALFNFYENDYIASLGASFMESGNRNIRVTGNPCGDAFLFPSGENRNDVWKCQIPGMKKVIWAPHWTIRKKCFFGASTFLECAEDMLKVAQQYEGKIQFAFKPHPTLYGELCSHPDWGKEKTDVYYKKWQDMPNTQLELGDYKDLFLQSDAMVHDCGSFSIEYLYLDKPCMFMQETDLQGLNQMTIDAIECHTKGHSREEIVRFLEEAVLQGKRDRQEKRAEYRKRYLIPPHNQSAGRNIVNFILNGLSE